MMPTARVVEIDPIPMHVPLGYQRCVQVHCPHCGRGHWHAFPGVNDDGRRVAPCGQTYRIAFA